MKLVTDWQKGFVMGLLLALAMQAAAAVLVIGGVATYVWYRVRPVPLTSSVADQVVGEQPYPSVISLRLNARARYKSPSFLEAAARWPQRKETFIYL